MPLKLVSQDLPNGYLVSTCEVNSDQTAATLAYRYETALFKSDSPDNGWHDLVDVLERYSTVDAAIEGHIRWADHYRRLE